MSDNFIVHADGCVEYGGAVYEPWPSLKIRPSRNTSLCEKIISAGPGSPLWPYTAQIPRDVLQLARRAPANSWALLEFAASYPERAVEILRECPALAVLVVQSCACRNIDRFVYFRNIAALPWRKVLAELKLPPTPRVIRLLRKLPIEHCRVYEVCVLHGAIQRGHTWLHALSHLERISADTIALLRLKPETINSKLLHASSLSEDPEDLPTRWLIESVKWFLDLEQRGSHWPYRNLDFDALAKVEAKFRLRHTTEFELFGPFPPPPVEGIPSKIEPLRNYQALAAEAELQQNCALDYAPGIAAGKYYFYAVTTLSQRATVCIRLHDGRGTWRVDDIRGPKNADVNTEVEGLVRAWLREHNGEAASEN